MDNVVIRKATIEDLDQILDIYAAARDFMRQNGNPHQWGEAYPPLELIKADIEKGQLYVCSKDGQTVGVFCFFCGTEPDYREIYEGEWLRGGESGIIHRIAVLRRSRGIAERCFDYAFQRCRNIKIDTHRCNIPMQRCLEKNGFTRCGIIYLQDGTERIAYQKV